MRKIITYLLIFCLLVSFSGCYAQNAKIQEPVLFYYCRNEYQYHDTNNVIVSEEREIAGHSGDWYYILTLYFMGPTNEKLVSPFPKDTQLLSYIQNDDNIQLSISDLDENLSDAKFSLACACLCLTFLDCAPYEEITITSGQRSITIARNDLLLLDQYIGESRSLEVSK